MASNPEQIPAGGKDKISVVVHTQNRGGQTLNKRFTVYTNDPKKERVVLRVIGKVKAYVDYSPKRISFSGTADQKLSQTVRVMPIEQFPFKIKKVKAKEGKHLRYELKPLPRKNGPDGYQLIVHNTMTSAGRYQDVITIETDSKVKPELKIRVYGRIGKPSPQAQKGSL